MYYARHGIIPPEEWEHDPTIKSSYGYIVADYLRIKHAPVP